MEKLENGSDLPGKVDSDGSGIRDVKWQPALEASEIVYNGRLISVRRDVLLEAGSGYRDRFTVEHPGAIGVVAIDDQGRALLMEQDRVTVRRRLVQIPAGILDKPGETPLEAAKRELAEETDLTAQHWSPLLSYWPTPGISSEYWHIFLAQGLSEVPQAERQKREFEEANVNLVWVPIPMVLRAIDQGRINDGMVIAAIQRVARLMEGQGSLQV